MAKMKKILGLAMAAVLCTASVMPAMAEGASETYTDENGVTYTTTTTVTEEGKNTVTVEIKEWNNAAVEDAEVAIEGEQTTVETENKKKENTVVDGEETQVEVLEEKPEEETYPEVEVKVELVEGVTNTAYGVTGETVTDNVPGGSTANNSDITTVTDVERTVSATTEEVEVKVNDVDTGMLEGEEVHLEGVEPTYDVIDGKKEDKGGMFDYQFNSGATSKYSNPDNWTNMPEDAEVRYVGTGEHSKYYVAIAYVEYEKDEEGNTIYDEEGKPVIKEIRRHSGEDAAELTIDGVPVTELPDGITLEPVYDNYGGSRPFMFMLMNKEGDKFYGYCCDLDTDAGEGKYYTMTNLEDNDYYASEESSNHLRSIMMNGYWGTTDIPDEKGNYAFGSLSLLKQKMIAAIDAGEYPNTELTAPVLDPNNKYQPVVDENGEIVYTTKTMKEMIEGLTSGEALLATQAAVWSFSNGHTGVLNGQDGSIVLDPDGYKWNHDAMSNSKTAGGYTNGEAMDDFASAAVDFMYTWLMNLDTEEESTTVINDKHFVEDMSLVVGEKVEDAEANTDTNEDNDVYETSIKFTLAFVPDPKTDDLLVYLTDENGAAINDKEGNPIVRRLAGTAKEGDNVITPEEDGSYILSGLQLAENDDFTFDLRLEGTQYLEKGVYVYEACGGRENSQNFIGVAEGERNVDVSASMTIT
ncbi:MAG: Cys-Gln thioester bond-forming surface protein, partial [Clostridia bacterium]|nr:Cys-Gln thioester bond-forming surface protein [Clostridia bacterium]